MVVQGRGRPGAGEVLDASWIETRAIRNPARVQPLRVSLGVGESEAIVLAHEISSDLVIMDELAGRRELSRQALPMLGILGVLQQAKVQGFILALRPELDALLGHGFYISQRVYKATLAKVGE